MDIQKERCRQKLMVSKEATSSVKPEAVGKMPTLSYGTRTLILATIIMCSVCSVDAIINPQTILKCLPRQYTFRASKTIRINGKILPCWDDVTVYSCWGRCDSYEYGDYKIPYKVSYHPVCTYTDQTARQVRLRKCHPEHPDPTYEVFDATVCSCTMCDSDNTSCENLNG